MRHHTPWICAALLCSVSVPLVRADEGMWLFNNPPTKQLKEKYGFEPTAQWLEHVQKAAVRFNSGGSGSFISADGLVMTNHHVASGVIQQLSNQLGRNYMKEGYHARTRAEELKAPNLELNVLLSIEDVTAQVRAAVKPGSSSAEAFAARRAAIATIEKDSEDKTKLRSNVVTLYQGNQYHLYRFKRYTDVRLVFAPEDQIAFFGGDPDNFAFPRYNLDVTFFRVYENNAPIKVEHYFTWSKGGAAENELVFVSGHPGSTNRLNTVAELKYLRDIGYPFLLERLHRWEVMLTVYSARGPEYERKAKNMLFGVANSRKAREGGLAGLLDPVFMKNKLAQEQILRDAVAKSPELKDLAGAWKQIEDVQKVRAANIKRYTLLEGGAAFNTTLFGYARTLVRNAVEKELPNEKRLSEFGESGKKSLELQLLADTKLYPDYEITKLADSLTWLCEVVGYDDTLVQKVLAGKAPRDRAAELVLGSKLADPKERQRLYTGGKEAVASSEDALIVLAQSVDAESRAVRKIMETQFEEVKRQGYDQIAKAKFAVEGTNTYPDATFTLRLAYGTVKGYEEEGKKIPYQTTYAGLYERAKEQLEKAPFDLPKRWVERKDKLNLKTPFNFVCTADIIGGNSGSPVINKNAEIVGIIFDGNIQSLVLDFAFTDTQARAVSVHSQGILEGLRAMYDATELVAEIVNGKGQ